MARRVSDNTESDAVREFCSKDLQMSSFVALKAEWALKSHFRARQAFSPAVDGLYGPRMCMYICPRVPCLPPLRMVWSP